MRPSHCVLTLNQLSIPYCIKSPVSQNDDPHFCFERFRIGYYFVGFATVKILPINFVGLKQNEVQTSRQIKFTTSRQVLNSSKNSFVGHSFLESEAEKTPRHSNILKSVAH